MTTQGRDGHAPVIRIFDGVGVEGVDGPVDIGGRRQRRLLALLALRSGSVVDVDWLAEYLWSDDDRPVATTPTLRTAVYRLRSALPEVAREWIQTEPDGYRLAAPDDAVEHRRFAMLRAQALAARQQGDHQAALASLDAGLGLWRGDPFRELEDLEWAYAEIERLRMDRLEMMEERWEAALALGRHTQIVGELGAFTTEHADRDRSIRQYALALHRSGRTAEALKVISRHKKLLVEEYGLDPSAAIDELERALLAGDPALAIEARERPLRGYRLLDEIGIGAFSVVWRASQPSVGREVAIKQIRAELANQPAFIRHFEAEAHLVARIEHPYVVPLIDFWRDPDSAYLVMRLLRGGTLEQRLVDGPLGVEATLRLARQVGDALTAAHALGVVHRDVKPANILFDEAGNAFLGDFGIALEASGSDEVAVARLAASPAYASPEQLRGEPLGPASDIYSLGAVLYESLSGSLPRSSAPSPPPPSEVHAELPAAIFAALSRATAPVSSDRFESVSDFVAALEAATGAGRSEPERGPVAANSSTLPVANPYLGLRSFDDADADRFFGRERLVRDLLDRLAGTGPKARCLVVVGPSGSGKSSVVRAGLIPALRADAIPGSRDWFVTSMVPGLDPFASLEAALLGVASSPLPSLAETMRSGDGGLLRSIRSTLPSEGDRLVLVIDQLEELFVGAASDAAADFLAALAVAVTDPSSPLRLVATLRADFYDRPLEHPTFAPVLGPATVTVPPLDRDELERAIEAPAQRVGVRFEDGLAARIVAQTQGQPSPLPLLQYTLWELFDRRHGGELTLAGLERIGGLAGTIAARAEAIHVSADAQERTAIRHVFGKLTDPTGTTADLRRRALVSDLGDEQATTMVLEHFGAARLITFDHDVTTREPTVEVAHEALLREWPRLAAWLDEDRELLRRTDELAGAANRWVDGGRSDEELLRGARLEGATDLVAAERLRVRPLDIEFVKASQGAALAEERVEARRKRRGRLLLSGIGLALVVAIATGSLAVLLQRRADDEALAASVAQGRADLVTLIRRAGEEPDPTVGLLLALEAQRRAPGPETDAVLLAALGRAGNAETIASFAPLVTDRCAGISPGWVSREGTYQTATVDGVAVRRDLVTGDVRELGAMPSEGCLDWYLDERSGRGYAVAEDRSRLWLGSPEASWVVDLKLDGSSWVNGPAGLAGSRLLLEGPSWVRLIDAESGAPVSGPIIGLDDRPLARLSSSGEDLAVAIPQDDRGGPASVAVYDAIDGRMRFGTSVTGVPTALYFDPQTDELLVGTAEGHLLTIDLRAGELVADVETRGQGVSELAVRDDGSVLVLSAGPPGTIELVDRRRGPLGSEPDGLDNVSGAVLRPDGLLVAWSPDSRVDVLDLEARPLVNDRIELLPDERGGPDDGLEIHGGRALLIDRQGVEDRIVDLATGERTPADMRTGDGGRFPASSEPMLVDSGYTAISAEMDVGLWEDGELVAEQNVSPSADDSLVAFAHEGSRVLVGSGPLGGVRTGQLLDVGDGQIRQLMTVNVTDIDVLFGAPTADDGLLLVDASGVGRTYAADGSVADRFTTGVNPNDSDWLMVTDGRGRTAIARPGAIGLGTQIDIIDRAQQAVHSTRIFGDVVSLGFAREGDVLVIQTADGAVRFHDVDAGVTSGVVWAGVGAREHTPWYDEDSDSVWVASSDEIVELSLDREAWRARACQKTGRDLTPDEWERLIPGDAPQALACGDLLAASSPAAEALVMRW